MAQITWTILPNGLNNQQLKFSIFVSLRLDASELADGFNWADAVAALPNQIDVLFSNEDGSDETSAQLNLDRSLLTPSLWNTVFPTNALVTPRSPINLGARTPISFPVKAIREQINTVYKDTAQRFGIVPPRALNDYESGEQDSELYDFIVEVGDEFRCRERVPPPEPPDPVVAFAPDPYEVCEAGHPPINQLANTGPFYRAYRFYRRSKNNQPTPDDPVNGWPKPQVPQIDAHQAMGALGDHPALMRRLGLVIDGTVPPNQAPDVGRVRVVSDGNVTPWTRYTRSGDKLVATPNPDPVIDTDLSLGLLKLGETSERFDFHQLDIDGAALNLGNYAVNLLQTLDPAEDEPTANLPPVDAEVPNLRTAGFAIAKNERSDTLMARLTRSFMFEGQTMPVLFADDVTRGYRLDVRNTDDGIWRSLTQRHGWFLLGDAAQRVPASGEIHDEGFIKGASATSDPVNEGDELVTSTKPIYIHELLFTWNGWSPVIKPPGKEMYFDRNIPAEEGPEVVTQVENTPQTDFKVQPVFKVEPGTLPRLRFGQEYQLRARAVDLAGNSLPLSLETEESTVITPAETFFRYEPIPAPVLVLRRRVVEGESVEHIVIRSGSAKQANDLFFNQNDRHLAAPTTTLDLVIMHGMLDPLFNDPEKSFNIALKSEGTFLDQQIYDTKTGNKKNVPGIQVLNTDGTQGEFPAERGAGLQAGQYVIHANNKLLLPYLPDPLALGVALADARDTADQNPEVGLNTIFYSGEWPDPEPFKIVVSATEAEVPSVVVSGGNFVVRLPPATILPLTFSSLISEQDLTTKMAIWQLIDPNEVEDFETFHTATLNGQHWMITPRRELVAVHAVDRPLRAAMFTELTVNPERVEGDTFVRLQGVIDNHSRSTGQIDIEANWEDQVDLLTQPGPTVEAHGGRVFTVRPLYDQSSLNVPETTTLDNEERPKQDFGDTKHRFVRYRPDATTRYREYFPASFTSVRDNILTVGEEFEVNIPSSARPAEPQVLYIIPTFRWETEIVPTGNGNNGAPGSATSRRIGRGLRVYLARPWFSSGDGEKLGVVLSQNSTPTDAELRYVSEWGDDPVWRGNAWSGEPTMSRLAISDFTNPDFVSTDDLPEERLPLPIVEDAAVQVQAVGFNVEYNAERQVWFADIEMGEISSYLPFVRLALARLQPDSIPGLELSPIVKAQFIQLVNDRVATLQLQASTIQVSVSGIAARNRIGDIIADALTPPMTPPTAPPGFQFDPEAGAGRLLTVHVEQRGPGNSDDEWEVVASPVTLPSFSPTSPTTESEVLWTGNVPRPPRTPASFKHRLVIKEHEVFRTDADTAETLPIPTLEDIFARSRVTYLDVIPLDDIVN